MFTLFYHKKCFFARAKKENLAHLRNVLIFARACVKIYIGVKCNRGRVMKMKQILLIMVLIFALAALAACSEPTEPEVPDSGNSGEEPPLTDEAKVVWLFSFILFFSQTESALSAPSALSSPKMCV